MRTFVIQLTIEEGNDEFWEGHPEYNSGETHLPTLSDVARNFAAAIYDQGNEIAGFYVQDGSIRGVALEIDGVATLFPEEKIPSDYADHDEDGWIT